ADCDGAAVAVGSLVRPAGRDEAAGHGSGAADQPARQDRTTGSREIASRSAATRVVRGTTEATSRYSAGAWSPPPIGPRPSRLGMPIPAVVFASEAPPVAASRSSN